MGLFFSCLASLQRREERALASVERLLPSLRSLPYNDSECTASARDGARTMQQSVDTIRHPDLVRSRVSHQMNEDLLNLSRSERDGPKSRSCRHARNPTGRPLGPSKELTVWANCWPTTRRIERARGERAGLGMSTCFGPGVFVCSGPTRTDNIPSRLQAEPSRATSGQSGYSSGFRVPKTVVSRSKNTLFGVGTLFINPGR